MSIKPLKQILFELNDLENKTKNYLKSVGYKSELASIKYKHIISLHNSISIVLLHFSLDIHALKLLQKSLKNDIKMFYSGTFADRSWNGRILIYCNLSYLFLKCDDLRSSLKFLYDSENLIYEIENSGKNINDIKLGHSILTYLALIKIKKFENSQKYLTNAIQAFEQVSERFNEISCNTIFCILEFFRIFMIGFSKDSFFRVDQALYELENYDVNESIFKNFSEKIKKIKIEGAWELIQSSEFYEIVFVSFFFPFITKNTPEVSVEELMRIKEQQKKITKFDLSKIISNGKKYQQDNYSLLMKKALEEVHFQ